MAPVGKYASKFYFQPLSLNIILILAVADLQHSIFSHIGDQEKLISDFVQTLAKLAPRNKSFKRKSCP